MSIAASNAISAIGSDQYVHDPFDDFKKHADYFHDEAEAQMFNEAREAYGALHASRKYGSEDQVFALEERIDKRYHPYPSLEHMGVIKDDLKGTVFPKNGRKFTRSQIDSWKRYSEQHPLTNNIKYRLPRITDNIDYINQRTREILEDPKFLEKLAAKIQPQTIVIHEKGKGKEKQIPFEQGEKEREPIESESESEEDIPEETHGAFDQPRPKFPESSSSLRPIIDLSKEEIPEGKGLRRRGKGIRRGIKIKKLHVDAPMKATKAAKNKNRKTILRGEIRAGNDNPHLKRALKALDSAKITH